MAVTKDQVISGRDFHYTGKHECSRTEGPRGGITENITRVRANGACKTWKRSPERFQQPIKYGLYEYHYITESNASDFHLASECPLNK